MGPQNVYWMENVISLFWQKGIFVDLSLAFFQSIAHASVCPTLGPPHWQGQPPAPLRPRGVVINTATFLP